MRTPRNSARVQKRGRRRNAHIVSVLLVLGVVVIGAVAYFGRTQAAVTWPTTPPAQICGSPVLNGGPVSAPVGAVSVPAGDNSAIDFEQANTSYWFAPGVHTLGGSQYDQIAPGNNATFIGAPGAILDGQRKNNYAFTQKAGNVTIRYLTIRNFTAPRDEGVVNHDAGPSWTIEYSTVTLNDGAGLMAGSNNLYRYNCLKDNGQYAINACCGTDSDAGDIQSWTLDHNEIVGNNTADWEAQVPGCGCTGGVKFWLNKNVTVTNNYVHNNRGVGLWLDNNNRGFDIESNYISNNDGMAIMAEAGYDFTIKNNNIIGNAVVEGREFAGRGDPFPIGAIYISESGSPAGYGIRYVPSVISNNNFSNNWGGVNLWENADRYSGSSAHTHVSGTVKIGNLYSDAMCNGAGDTIPAAVGDKFRCRWSTENVIVENNEFNIDKAALACAGGTFCGVSGMFSNYGTYPEFSTFLIPWRITFQQGNIFRNNHYYGDWRFAGWETSARATWASWTAAAPSVPANVTAYSPPTTYGQDVGSTYNSTPAVATATSTPAAAPGTATPTAAVTVTPSSSVPAHIATPTPAVTTALPGAGQTVAGQLDLANGQNGTVTIKVDGAVVSTNGKFDTTLLTNGIHTVTVTDATGKTTTQTIKIANKLTWWQSVRNQFLAPFHGNPVALSVALGLAGIGVLGVAGGGGWWWFSRRPLTKPGFKWRR